MQLFCFGLVFLFFSSSGQTGKTLPSICGTNTDYHSKYHSSCTLKLYISLIIVTLPKSAKSLSLTFTFPVYVEFGATSTDTISLTHTLGSTTSTLKWNILAQQIPCTATYWSTCSSAMFFRNCCGLKEILADILPNTQGAHRLSAVVHRIHWNSLQLQPPGWPGDISRNGLELSV